MNETAKTMKRQVTAETWKVMVKVARAADGISEVDLSKSLKSDWRTVRAHLTELQTRGWIEGGRNESREWVYTATVNIW